MSPSPLPPLTTATKLFKALADETRLRIVALLTHGELCVCHIQTALELPQPTISRHMAVLRAAGLVSARRAGSWIHYSLRVQDDPLADTQLQALIDALSGRAALRRQVAKLRACCGPRACP